MRHTRCRVLFFARCGAMYGRNELEECERLCETALRVSDRKGEEASMILAEVPAYASALRKKPSHQWGLGKRRGRKRLRQSPGIASGHDRVVFEGEEILPNSSRPTRFRRGEEQVQLWVYRCEAPLLTQLYVQNFRAAVGDVPQDRPRQGHRVLPQRVEAKAEQLQGASEADRASQAGGAAKRGIAVTELPRVERYSWSWMYRKLSTNGRSVRCGVHAER